MKIIIFAGGYGTRMWPVSRVSRPKQFCKIVRGRSFFERTIARFNDVFDYKDIFVSTEESYLRFVREQAPKIPKENIIIEPERRDTLGAIGLVAAIIERKFPQEIMFFSWSDHFISDNAEFLRAVKAAGEFTQKTGKPTSINEKPTFPSVYNGWLKIGKKVGREGKYSVFEILKHVEKPDLETAKKYLKSDRYLIHTGYGAWKSDSLLGYYKKYCPEVYRGLSKIMAAWGTSAQERVLRNEYSKFEKVSIDNGLFEKLPRNLRVTIPVATGWEDAGTWALFYDAIVEKGEKNVIEGAISTEFLESEGNLIVGNAEKLISVIGLNNIVVIDTEDALMVCDKRKTDQVKALFKIIEEKYPKYVK
jgi:mannose-1-phosphate guanylyltransferase